MKIIVVLCLFLACVYSTVVYSENFDNPITGWTKSSASIAPLAGWIQGTSVVRSSPGFQIPVVAGGIIAVNDDKCGECDGSNDLLTTPTFSIPNEPMVAVSFDVFYTGVNGEVVTIQLTTAAGVYNLIYPITPNAGWKRYRYPLFQFGGNDVTLQFKSSSNANFISSGVALDNFLIESFSSQVDLSLNWGFEDGNLPPGWTKTQDGFGSEIFGWIVGTVDDRSSGYCDIPQEATIGTNVIAANDDQCYCQSGNDFLISNIISVPNGITYGFINLEYFYIPYFHSFTILFSVNGGSFSSIFNAPEVADFTFWEPFYFDLAPYAGMNVQFKFWGDDQGIEAAGCIAVDNFVIRYYPMAITSSAISSASVTSNAITSSALTTSPAEITSAKITSASVTSSEMTSSAVTSSAITSSALTSSDVTSSAISSSAITSSEITSSDVTSSEITSASVTSSPITSSQVTSSPITSSQVTSSRVTSSQVTSSRVTSSQVTSSQVTSSRVTSNRVTSASASITSAAVTSNRITSTRIVTSNRITTSRVTSSRIVTSGKLTTQNVNPNASGASIITLSVFVIFIILAIL